MFWPTPSEEMDINMGLPTSTVRGKSFRMEAWQTLSSHTTSRQGYYPTLSISMVLEYLSIFTPLLCPGFACQYSSTMVRIWVHRDNVGHCPKSGLKLKPCSDKGESCKHALRWRQSPWHRGASALVLQPSL